MQAFVRFLKVTTLSVVTALVSLPPARADFLNLRDGTVLEGIFEGASVRDMHFRVDGVVRRFPLRIIRGLELSPRPEAEALSSVSPKPTERCLLVGSNMHRGLGAASILN